MKIFRAASPTLPVALLLSGCAERSAEGGLFPDLPVIQAVEDLRIDGYAADLVPIGWIGVSRDGSIAVAQQQDRGIRFFDASGDTLGFVGGPGEGPGEFRSLAGGGWIGDTLWVSDTQLRRLTLISAKLEVLRTVPHPSPVSPPPEEVERLPEFQMVVPYGLYVDGSQLVVPIPTVGQVREYGLSGSLLLMVSEDGRIFRHVFTAAQDERASFSVQAARGTATVSVPFFPRLRWAVSPDGTRAATLSTHISGPEGGFFTVTVYDPRVGVMFARDYAFPGTPIPEHVVDSVLESFASRARSPELARAYRTEARSRVPPIYPPVDGILLDSEGSVWIELHDGDERNDWLVLDSGGQPVARVNLPAGVHVQVAGVDHVWGIIQDEFDVESIVRYRLLRG